MSERFLAKPILDGLKPFQQATVVHVMRRFFDDEDATRRFLVADETGLGKSMVARGVIASVIERLQDDRSVDRIDIVYVCSNGDIAQQNIARLDVTGEPHLPFASRLTMLAKEAGKLAGGNRRYTKRVNLVSFTPGTSFDMGWRTGKAEERALLFLLLGERLDLTKRSKRHSAGVLLQATVGSVDTFLGTVYNLKYELAESGLDPVITDTFLAAAESSGLIDEFTALQSEIGRKSKLPDELRRRCTHLTGRLRAELARASVEKLEPDLVILDEFQRFRHLLNPDEGGAAAELAEHLFNFRDSRVLLLSATPYKPFTYAEEAAAGDDHFKDVMVTLQFLANGSGIQLDDVAADFAAYRQAALSGGDAVPARDRLQDRLLNLMCRTERPVLGGRCMLVERALPAAELDPGDVCGFAALRALARHVGAAMHLDYWKSAPYFVNFMDGYQLGDKLREALKDPKQAPDLMPLLEDTSRISREDVQSFRPIGYGNARLQRLAEETVEAGWWQLLWMPPSLPYTTPGGPYAIPAAQAMTKRLVFSSWAATPTAIASLLSYEAERQTADGFLEANTPEARSSVSSRLDFTTTNRDAAGSMTTLALFWPNPALAALSDPLSAARAAGDALLSPKAVEDHTAKQVAGLLALASSGPSASTSREAWYWGAPLTLPGAVPLNHDEDGIARAVEALSGGDPGDDRDREGNDESGLHTHVEQAFQTAGRPLPAGAAPGDLASVVTQLGLYAPGNVAWRALRRLLEDGHEVTADGHWRAAAVIASGFRSLFNRPETILLLDRLLGRPTSSRRYWQNILRYCAWGNLQAVMDEFIHHLASSEVAGALTDAKLLELAKKARTALTLRHSPYEAFDPTSPGQRIRFMSRFALRYGSGRNNEESARQPDIRTAFNSPFWPFVLATTSVGQEGIDFHWWCHSVVHWNTPSNPVDFDQREGRVHRYGGHAIRRNLIQHHRAAILDGPEADPWRTAFRSTVADRHPGDELAPHWVYDGDTKVERVVLPYPLSNDVLRLQRLKDDLALYRLTFGQPRQEDLLDLLRRRGVQHDDALLASLRVDLRPPALGAEPDI